MAKLSKKDLEWKAEKYGMEKTCTMILGETLKVLDIEPECPDAIGYTSAQKTIHIAHDHPVMDGLAPNEKKAFRRGVFAHELMHQVFTDFDATEKIMKTLPPEERQIFGTLMNVLEDPSIEYWASTVIGGPLLAALRFTIAHIYKGSPKIDESGDAMSQFVNALIHFGDMGIVKGNFTFPEAKEAFLKAAPIFSDGVVEPSCIKRLFAAKEIMEISRPLWQDEADAMKKLADLMEKCGKSAASGKGTGKDGDPDLAGEDKKSERRKVTIKKVTKEELDELKENGEVSEGPLPDDGDITILVCEDEDANPDDSSAGEPIPLEDYSEKSTSEEKSSGSKASEDKSSEDKSSESSSSSDEEEFEDKSAGSSSSSDGKESEDKNAEDGSSSDGEETESADGEATSSSKNSEEKNSGIDGMTVKPSGDAEFDADNEASTIDSEEFEISEEDCKAIADDIDALTEEVLEKIEEDTGDTSSIDEFDVSDASPALKGKNCLNKRITLRGSSVDTLSEEYANLVAPMLPGIEATSAQLKKIFQNDQEEREYRASGRINVGRLSSGKVTARVFDRRKAPIDKSNLAVEILVDESGSMYGSRIRAARSCCIALAEIFNKLNVPCYIQGFTADTEGYDIVHNHYVTWKNSKVDRLKLLSITDRCNNCDGYSVRYATEVIKKKDAKNKLLIVISDGQPACYGYSDGVADTRNAIKEAKKHTSVLGVAIGNSDTETIHYMYEADFLHISDVSDLFNGLSRKIKLIIKSWE